MNFVDSFHCISRVHCTTCRGNSEWRKKYDAPEQCPFNIVQPQKGLRGLGDVVAAITTAVGIKPCEGCKKRQDDWNKAVPFN